MYENTPISSKENLDKLHIKKKCLKNKYKYKPSQNLLLNILSTIKQINALETKFEN